MSGVGVLGAPPRYVASLIIKIQLTKSIVWGDIMEYKGGKERSLSDLKLRLFFLTIEKYQEETTLFLKETQFDTTSFF